MKKGFWRKFGVAIGIIASLLVIGNAVKTGINDYKENNPSTETAQIQVLE